MDMNTSKVDEAAANATEEAPVNAPTSETEQNSAEENASSDEREGSDEADTAADTPASESTEEQTDWQDRYMRLYAEFDNFRKRTMRERVDLIRNASKDVLEKMLPIVDDFARAEAAAESQDMAGLKEGQQLIYTKLQQTLKSQGVEQMGVKVGDAFDVDLHEAITRIPAPELSGKVVDVVESGYKLNDTVIRYAKVVVGE
jgi:molecular chaperone GrpE